MPVEFFSTTNPRFKYLEGTKGLLIFDDVYHIYWFNNFHTSHVKDVQEEEDMLIVTTLNSVYEFKKETK